MLVFVELPHKDARAEHPGKLLPSAPPILSPFWSFLVLLGAPSTFGSPRRFCFSVSSKRKADPPQQRHENTTAGTAGEHTTAGGTSALRDHSNSKPGSHTHISRRRDRRTTRVHTTDRRASGVQTTVEVSTKRMRSVLVNNAEGSPYTLPGKRPSPQQ